MCDLLRDKLSRNNYDLIFFDTISLPYLSLFRKEKLILNHHNIESDMMLRRAYNEKNLLKNYISIRKVKGLLFMRTGSAPNLT